MKNSIFLHLLVTYSCFYLLNVGASQDDETYRCPFNLTLCDCQKVSDMFKFICPPPEASLEYTVSYTPEKKTVRLECVAALPSPDDLFDHFDFSKMDSFEINTCMLPNTSLINVLGHIGYELSQIDIHVAQESNNITTSTFTGLLNLKILHLRLGGLMFIDSKALDELTLLEDFSLSDAILTDFPPLKFSPESIININLENNVIEHLPQELLHNLSNLVNLSLAYNHIPNLSEDFFKDLSNLVNLNLQNNQLTSLPSSIFKSMSNLTFLDISYNNIINLPNRLFEGNFGLIKLKLSFNFNLSGIPEDLFTNATQIKELEMDHNNITTLPKKLFAYQWKLRSLNLNNNRIQNIPANIFLNCTEIVNLDLSVNKLTSLSEGMFQFLHRLNAMKVANNQITKVSNKVFSNLPSLQYLDLSNNRIRKIEQMAFEESNNISRLDLAQNNLECSEFHELFLLPQNIRYVNATKNNISCIPREWMNSENLKSLNFSYNYFSRLETKQLLFRSKTIQIDLNYNAISTIDLTDFQSNQEEFLRDDAKHLSHIPTVLLDHNPLVCDCHLLSFILYLKSSNYQPNSPFRFEANNLNCNKPSDPFLQGRKLTAVLTEELYCDVETQCDPNCSCRRSSEGDQLVMECQNQNMTHFGSEAPAGVTILHLSGNRISSLDWLSKKEFVNMTKIYLDNNLMKSLGSPLDLPTNLRLFTLNDNKLERMPQWLMTKLSVNRNIVVKLGNNPWKCDCQAYEFLDWLEHSSNQVDDLKAVQCSYPENLQSKALITLDFTMICPREKPHSSGAIVVTILMTLILLLAMSIGIMCLVRHRYRVKMWLFRHKLCLWMRTQDDIEAGHPL